MTDKIEFKNIIDTENLFFDEIKNGFKDTVKIKDLDFDQNIKDQLKQALGKEYDAFLQAIQQENNTSFRNILNEKVFKDSKKSTRIKYEILGFLLKASENGKSELIRISLENGLNTILSPKSPRFNDIFNAVKFWYKGVEGYSLYMNKEYLIKMITILDKGTITKSDANGIDIDYNGAITHFDIKLQRIIAELSLFFVQGKDLVPIFTDEVIKEETAELKSELVGIQPKTLETSPTNAPSLSTKETNLPTIQNTNPEPTAPINTPIANNETPQEKPLTQEEKEAKIAEIERGFIENQQPETKEPMTELTEEETKNVKLFEQYSREMDRDSLLQEQPKTNLEQEKADETKSKLDAALLLYGDGTSNLDSSIITLATLKSLSKKEKAETLQSFEESKVQSFAVLVMKYSINYHQDNALPNNINGSSPEINSPAYQELQSRFTNMDFIKGLSDTITICGKYKGNAAFSKKILDMNSPGYTKNIGYETMNPEDQKTYNEYKNDYLRTATIKEYINTIRGFIPKAFQKEILKINPQIQKDLKKKFKIEA